MTAAVPDRRVKALVVAVAMVATLFAATAGAIPAGGSEVGLQAAPWPSFLRTPGHAGVAAVAGPTSGRLRWQRRLEGPIVPGVAIGDGGVAYVASNAGFLHAIRIGDGRDLWRFDGRGSYGSDLSTVPAILGDGVVLWPGPRQRLFALSPRGRPLWSLELTDDLLSPTLDEVPVRYRARAPLRSKVSGSARGTPRAVHDMAALLT